MPKNPLFFDTVVLSNFAFVENGLSLLKSRYKNRGKITLQVIQEIKKAVYVGYQELANFEDQIITKNGFQKVTLEEREQQQFLILIRNLGEGEASCVAAANYRSGIVVTDDRMARNCCRERNIPFTGTIGILKAAYQDSFIDLEMANSMLHQMIKRGFYSPVTQITE